MPSLFRENDRDVKFFPSTHTWTKDIHHTNEPRFVLQIENELVFKRGAINLVLGPTASGKTSVLMALLGKCGLEYCVNLPTYVNIGEMYSHSAENGSTCQLPRENGVAYAPQESWVLNDTIRVSSFGCAPAPLTFLTRIILSFASLLMRNDIEWVSQLRRDKGIVLLIYLRKCLNNAPFSQIFLASRPVI